MAVFRVLVFFIFKLLMDHFYLKGKNIDKTKPFLRHQLLNFLLLVFQWVFFVVFSSFINFAALLFCFFLSLLSQHANVTVRSRMNGGAILYFLTVGC